MADMDISEQEGLTNPAGNPDVKIGTDKNCMLCFQNVDDEFNFGTLYEFQNIVAHYYCLLLSSNMLQKGEDSDGIFGFLPSDIRREVARGKTMRCYYCKNKGATIGCCNPKCKRVFHLPCGRKNDSLHQFFAEFRSFCGDHRPGLNTRKLDVPQDSVCNICLEIIKPKPSISTVYSLLALCCKKWFHRRCLQKFALNSGYFFKCPMCNNKSLFQRGMLDHGIFIPERDASWELEPGAYRELLDRHNQCDARPCVCPKGRNLNSPGTRWALILCSSCGSQGMHVRCGKLNFKHPVWECSVCILAQKDGENQSAENNAARSVAGTVVEIEDSDDEVQILSSSSSNADEDCVIVCIDDEGGSPLQLVKSDTMVATPGGGAISVMTITACNKIKEVVGDLNVIHQQRLPNPSYTSPHIVSVVGGAQIIDDDDDDDDDVVIEKDCRKLPDNRTTTVHLIEDDPPPKRVKTAAEPPANLGDTKAVVPVTSSLSAGGSSQGSLPLEFTRQLQNMIIVSPANMAVGQQNGQMQLVSSPQQPVGGENQKQMGRLSIPVAGVDAVGSTINLQVMFPPGGTINLVQAPMVQNSSLMTQMPTLQFIQGVFPNASSPISSQADSFMPVPSSHQSDSISVPVSREPPPPSSYPQPTHTISTTSSLPTTSQITVSVPVTSHTPSSKVCLPTSSSLTTVQIAREDEEDDVQLVSEFPPDVSNRSLLKPSRGSTLAGLPQSTSASASENDIVVMIDTSKESINADSSSALQTTQSQDFRLGGCVNTDRNSSVIQTDTVLPGTSSSPQSTDRGKNSGATACSPDWDISQDKQFPKEVPGETILITPELTSTAGTSSSQFQSARQSSSSSTRSGDNRAELIPAYVSLSDLQFSYQNDSRVKVTVRKEFVIPINRDANCFHNTPNRRRSQNSRYGTEVRKYLNSRYKSRHIKQSTTRASTLSFSGERMAMRPIADVKANRLSKTRFNQDNSESDSSKCQQEDMSSLNLPGCSVDGKITTAAEGGQENVSPIEVCAGLNVMGEKMGVTFENEGSHIVRTFRGRGRGRRRGRNRLRLCAYSHRRKYKQ